MSTTVNKSCLIKQIQYLKLVKKRFIISSVLKSLLAESTAFTEDEDSLSDDSTELGE